MAERFCITCGKCSECPHGVNIQGNLLLYRDIKSGLATEEASEIYMKMEKGKRASACAACRICELKCPHKIPVFHQMDEVRKLLG